MTGNLSFENIAFLEEYLQEYSQAPQKLDSSWGVLFGKTPQSPVAQPDVQRLIEVYRECGHIQANIFPVGIKKRGVLPELQEYAKGFDAKTGERLSRIYCGPIGFEFVPFCSKEVTEQLIKTIEPLDGKYALPLDMKLSILRLLGQAETFEAFLHTRYVGQKRFSLEGAETLIPMLSCLLDRASHDGLEELVIGMSHRGRLNVLANILNKSYKEIFSEFEDIEPDTFEGSGDVKYHKGFTSEITLSTGKKMNVWLAANPSHLESVDPVVEGIVRSGQTNGKKSLPVLIHGDAALSGQGIVYETLQLSSLKGYRTGGTVHIVINNHIGFTTLPEDGRSTYYCTDIAKAFGFPIFHVNAEDPESCVWAVLTALEIRQRFGIDVFIDLNCFRKYGHNESDEPAFTQPLVYQVIRKKELIRTLFHDALIKEGVVDRDHVVKIDEEFRKLLHAAFQEAKARPKKSKKVKEIETSNELHHGAFFSSFKTAVRAEILKKIAIGISIVPDGFTLHPKISQLVRERHTKLENNFLEYPVDWSFAEALAIGSILQAGKYVRLAGQDSRRGTFSQRHGVWIDQVTEKQFFPLRSLAQKPEQFELIDSPLSEFAALGFEYGYSLGDPKASTFWEAQFGDFANGAQVIIDQYIASGEQKWGVHSRLGLLLPHGYEGQGPEHSSARIERFLALCADDNLIVVNPTTPAQYFHLLRRQALKEAIVKPLIIFTPKGLLRYPFCLSSMQTLVEGHFEEIIDDSPQYKKAKRLLFCQGRIYYDLIKHRDSLSAIIRLEQLYPFHRGMLEKIITSYQEATEFFWVQEEPYNMGAWKFLKERIERLLPRKAELKYRGRAASSSPAVGSHRIHDRELARIMQSLFFTEST